MQGIIPKIQSRKFKRGTKSLFWAGTICMLRYIQQYNYFPPRMMVKWCEGQYHLFNFFEYNTYKSPSCVTSKWRQQSIPLYNSMAYHTYIRLIQSFLSFLVAGLLLLLSVLKNHVDRRQYMWIPFVCDFKMAPTANSPLWFYGLSYIHRTNSILPVLFSCWTTTAFWFWRIILIGGRFVWNKKGHRWYIV